MKKLALSIIGAMMVMVSAFAQEPVASETKEVEISKAQLFAFTKMFIADKWENVNNALVNADEELGVLQVQSETVINIKQGMGLGCQYQYDYTVRFRVKDNKYRIEIYDVICTDADQVGLGSREDIPLIEYFEGDEPKAKTQTMGRGANKKQAKQVMDELRAEFQTIIDSYAKYIETNSNDDF